MSLWNKAFYIHPIGLSSSQQFHLGKANSPVVRHVIPLKIAVHADLPVKVNTWVQGPLKARRVSPHVPENAIILIGVSLLPSSGPKSLISLIIVLRNLILINRTSESSPIGAMCHWANGRPPRFSHVSNLSTLLL